MSSKYSNTDLINLIGEKTGLYNYQVKSVIVWLVRILVSELSQGREVNIISLGKFWLKRCPQRYYYDPLRSKKILRQERLVPRFTFGRRVFAFIRAEVSKVFNRISD